VHTHVLFYALAFSLFIDVTPLLVFNIFMLSSAARASAPGCHLVAPGAGEEE
jgi:hypothetical protein